MQLPQPLTERPLVASDAAAVTDVMAVCELADLGEVMIEEADIVGEWQRPSYDVSANTIGVFDGDRLVAYAEASGGDRGDAAVHPDYQGRGHRYRTGPLDAGQGPHQRHVDDRDAGRGRFTR